MPSDIIYGEMIMTEPTPVYLYAEPEPVIIPTGLYPFECPGCGTRLGDIVEYSGRRWFMRGGLLHAQIGAVCAWCGEVIQVNFS